MELDASPVEQEATGKGSPRQMARRSMFHWPGNPLSLFAKAADQSKENSPPVKPPIVRIEFVLRIMVSIVLAVALFAFRLMPADFRGDRLIEAATANHELEVRLFLWLGADVNYTAGNGTALHQAAFHGNVNMVAYLLDHGALVDAPAKFGATPLWQAREMRQIAVERLLLARGANPDTSRVGR